VKILKKKNKNSICSELPKKSMLPKTQLGPLGIKGTYELILTPKELGIV